jgi:uncharacterized protein YcfJ
MRQTVTSPVLRPFAAFALGLGLIASVATSADARPCRRMTKTQGAVVGAAGGAVLGAVLTGGVAGTVVGAAAGGIAGHEIARNGRHRCYRHRR